MLSTVLFLFCILSFSLLCNNNRKKNCKAEVFLLGWWDTQRSEWEALCCVCHEMYDKLL